jgi:hypothetical protein
MIGKPIREAALPERLRLAQNRERTYITYFSFSGAIVRSRPTKINFVRKERAGVALDLLENAECERGLLDLALEEGLARQSGEIY